MTDRRADDDAPLASEVLAAAAAEAVDPLARAYLGRGLIDLAALADARGAADSRSRSPRP
jgi:hypothetical protein